MALPRLLWVTPEPPDRGRGGGSIRQSHLLEAVARAMTVDLIVIGGSVDDHCRPLLRDIEELPEPDVRRLPAWLPGSAGVIWENEVLRMTSAVADTRRHRKILATRLRQRSGAYDLVHLEHDRLAPLAGHLAAPRKTITLHNLRSEQAAQRIALETTVPRRWLAHRTRAVALRFERAVVRDFDTVFVASRDDAAALGGGSVVVPNGVDVESIRPSPLPEEPRLVFTGRLDWQPNVEGIQWFCHQVMPRIRDRLPQARLDIVGFDPVPEVVRLQSPAIEVHANVPSTLPFLQAARVAVVPVQIGSGTRLKALEAMSAGRPVAGTRVGLAGLDLQAGRHAEIHDDPAALAAAAERLLRDDAAAQTLALAARAHVEKHFGWGRISEAFATTLRGLSGGPYGGG